MDFHLALHPHGELTAQIYGQLRDAIRAGRLAAGERLPPSRALAAQLGVSRKTVTEAYEMLASEGFTAGRVGAGTFVAAVPGLAAQAAPAKPVAAIPLPRWQALPTPFLEIASAPRLRHDFRGGATDRSLLPQAEWRRCMMEALRWQVRGDAEAATVDGLPRLRGAIARQLAVSRAVRCEWSDVMVTSGAQQAIDLVGRVLLEPGAVVAMEDPGYPPAFASFSAQGARVVSVPVDGEGMVVEALPDSARLVYVTPSHQFPLGMPMSLPRRRALLHWAARRGAVILEDDYDSEFRYEGRALEALHSLDDSGLVAYAGTFSKTLTAELRLGYLVMPPALRPALRQAKHLCDWYSQPLLQFALARLIERGDFARHARRCHKHYAARRAALLAALRGPLADWLAPIPAMAGIHLAARLQQPLDLGALVERGRGEGLGLYPLDAFHRETPPLAGLLFGFGGTALDELQAGLQTLERLLRTA
ncbi:MocR-like pyridoxine biosynthesis transcription factor PdxR [Chitinimonas koreensis]|uniref:MocR-like pyridoxine biosynthesis transcription factor PdxR n=1 Tax=Chitinimonas koreensis TaxID=356302 RepID=UPI0003F8F779|nr:PLP-dependent aminotransferase family protein [Chitinimonas koreensis]QNM95016.1 PLP-dependent aminotransferase family protein [Chitinimonas koreensis]